MCLGFGALASLLGYGQLQIARDNPSPTEIGCTRGQIEAVGERRWVVITGCELRFENTVLYGSGDDVDEVWFPLYAPDAEPDAPPVTVVTSRESSLVSAMEDIQYDDPDDAEAERLLGIVADKLDPERPQGVTDRTAHRLEMVKFFGEGARDIFEIDHGREPSEGTAWSMIGVGVILLGVGGVLGVRALRARREPVV
jgi:hypothetical protein